MNDEELYPANWPTERRAFALKCPFVTTFMVENQNCSKSNQVIHNPRSMHQNSDDRTMLESKRDE